VPHFFRPLQRRDLRAALVLASLLLAGARPAAPPAGEIKGSVRDQAGSPIANAQVFVVGTSLNTVTDTSGAYRLRQVPVGTHAVRAAFIGYHSTEVTNVPVRKGKVTRVDLILEQTAVEISEITVLQYGAPGAEAAAVTTKTDAVPLMPRSAGVAAGIAPASASPGNEAWNTENYAAIEESRFLPAASNPRSTFSIDVDAASYTNVRRFLTAGQRPPKDAVRIEEFLNYFRYDYPEPKGDDRFSVTTDLAVSPWAPDHRLLRIGIKGRSIRTDAVPPSNLVFLLDVSGSMQPPNKLPLVKQAFRLLAQELRPQDRVAIVVYAGAAGLVLPSTPGSDKSTILAALDRLEAGGTTAGGAGLRLAYEVARQHFARDGNNRVILATDGDFNVGESSDAAMVQLIEERRDQGIFLTVLGFGTGNLKDSRMEQIADKGNGHYAYVDNLNEARRVFVREFAGTLVTIAKDVKIQVEFNPAKVTAYRLVGYENRALRTEDFADDRKDAGELGAGHTVTALYELVPAGASLAGTGNDLDSLKYQQVRLRPEAAGTDEWLTVQLRYKEPTGSRSRLLTYPVRIRGRVGEPAGDFRFAVAVAGFGLVLRDSEYRGTATLDQVLELARGAEGRDADGERAEFVRLVESARLLHLAQRDETDDRDDVR
jgi:Ca-activated chloride channel family protein